MKCTIRHEVLPHPLTIIYMLRIVNYKVESQRRFCWKNQWTDQNWAKLCNSLKWVRIASRSLWVFSTLKPDYPERDFDKKSHNPFWKTVREKTHNKFNYSVINCDSVDQNYFIFMLVAQSGIILNYGVWVTEVKSY